jgi:Fe2+ or Zn2+ uptake regulation protein
MRDKSSILKEAKLKVTPKRMAILDILGDEPNYVSPEDVWKKLKLRFLKIGLPTVYRNLEDLARIGIISKIIHPNRQLYYYLCTHRTHHHHHHHFICLLCRRVEGIDFCPEKEIERIVRYKLRGRTVSHMLQINGICRECLSKEKKEEFV